MSITGNIIGMQPGAGGSFPMAGTRPKVRKSLTVVANPTASVTYQWTAPPNVYYVILSMCGGGGSGGMAGTNAAYADTGTFGAYYGIITSAGGNAGASISPSIIPVNPGSTYRLVAGNGGVPVTASVVSPSNDVPGNPGASSVFSGDVYNLVVSGGIGGPVMFFGQQLGGARLNTILAGGPYVITPVTSSINQQYNINYVVGGISPTMDTISYTLPTVYVFSASIVSDGVNTLGGLPTSSLTSVNVSNNYTYRYYATPGGNSAYGTGSAGKIRESFTSSLAGFGGGGGGALGYVIGSDGSPSLVGNGTSSAGGPGFVRLIWEE